jgi:hypothetical protein
MRTARWARWATCALAMLITPSLTTSLAFAEHKKSLAECTSFDQLAKGETAVELTVKNSCSIPVDCSLSWRVTCAPDSKKRRAVHASQTKFSLVTGAQQSTDASASVCGDDAWAIDQIEWTCAPPKD